MAVNTRTASSTLVTNPTYIRKADTNTAELDLPSYGKRREVLSQSEAQLKSYTYDLGNSIASTNHTVDYTDVKFIFF